MNRLRNILGAALLAALTVGGVVLAQNGWIHRNQWVNSGLTAGLSYFRSDTVPSPTSNGGVVTGEVGVNIDVAGGDARIGIYQPGGSWEYLASTGTTQTFTGTQTFNEISLTMGTAIAVVGAAQNIDPVTNVVHVSAGAAASVTTITAPVGNSPTEISFICNDANLTFNNTDAGGANTIDLAGAVNFVCSLNDVLTVVFDTTNSRWLEKARSVN